MNLPEKIVRTALKKVLNLSFLPELQEELDQIKKEKSSLLNFISLIEEEYQVLGMSIPYPVVNKWKKVSDIVTWVREEDRRLTNIQILEVRGTQQRT